MGVWRWDSEAIFFWLFFVKRIFYGDGTMRQFFSGYLLSEVFIWRWDSEAFFSFCLLLNGDGTVEMGQCDKFFGCLFAITRNLLPLPKKIFIT